jgi:DNA-nicking Smr family endonuclease
VSPPDRSRRRLSKDDSVLWSQFTKKIAPLRQQPAAAPADEADEPATTPRPQRIKSPPVLPKTAAKPAKTAPPLVTLGRREKQRVTRGKASIDARLDLHGHTQSEAHSALARFLQRASAHEAKLVLVITGKSGVLRRQVPQWLSLPELRDYVIGFETAGIGHGGEGALYVRVRRAR